MKKKRVHYLKTSVPWTGLNISTLYYKETIVKEITKAKVFFHLFRGQVLNWLWPLAVECFLIK